MEANSNPKYPTHFPGSGREPSTEKCARRSSRNTVSADMEEFLRYALIFVSLVVLLFDHCLTLTSEIEYIWRKRKTPFSCLFLLNRYFALFALLAYIGLYVVPHLHRRSMYFNGVNFDDVDTSRLIQACKHSGVSGTPLGFAFYLVTTLVAEVMLTLRAYAVYQHKSIVLFTLVSVWIFHLVLSVWIYERAQWSTPFAELNKRTLGISYGKSKGTLFVMPAILFDTIVGSLLTLGLYRRSGYQHVQMPLTRLIIRDGLLYFAVVFASDILWVLVYVFASGHRTVPALNFIPMAILSGCITTTMISRLTLNLRMHDPSNNELTFQTMSLKFRSTRQRTVTTRHATDGGSI